MGCSLNRTVVTSSYSSDSQTKKQVRFKERQVWSRTNTCKDTSLFQTCPECPTLTALKVEHDARDVTELFIRQSGGKIFFFTVIYNLFLTHFSVLKVYNMLVQGSATLNTNADTFIILQPIKSCKHFSTLLMTQLLTLYCCLTCCTRVQNNKKKIPIST